MTTSLGAAPAGSCAGLRVRSGTFRSPCHAVLPAESRLCHVEFCYPEAAARDLPWDAAPAGAAPRDVVILLPATGEEWGRLHL